MSETQTDLVTVRLAVMDAFISKYFHGPLTLPSHNSEVMNSIPFKMYQFAFFVERGRGERGAREGSLGLPGDGDTLGVAVLRGDGLLQLVQLARLLQLLHQALDGLLAPLLLLAVLLASPRPARAARRLLPAQQALHHRRREGQDGRHAGAREEDTEAGARGEDTEAGARGEDTEAAERTPRPELAGGWGSHWGLVVKQ